MDLVPTIVQQLTRFWLIYCVVQSVWSRRASWLQLVQRKCADATTTRSLVVIKVDCSASSQYYASAFSAVSSGFFLTLFWKNDNGCRAILLLLILCNTLVSVTELFAKDRKYDDLLPYTWLAVERATGIIINNSGKSEDLVLMTAERQTYRHRDRDIIQTCYSIVFLTTSALEAI